jgi:hypothetical protein
MRQRIQNLVCTAVVIAAGWLVWGNVHTSGQAYTRMERVRWEYRIEESGKSLELLNQYGKDGWELVTAMQVGNDVNNIVYQYVFKRPR